MIIILYILGALVGTAAYIIIAVVVHGLFERHSVLKFGLSLEDRVHNSRSSSDEWSRAEWSRAYDNRTFAQLVSVTWPLAPVWFVLRFIVRFLSWFKKSFLIGIHRRVMHTGLESKGASTSDTSDLEVGAYRSK